MYGYIYITTNLINNKKYIGQHKKEYFDPYYKGSGKLLTAALNKYGKDNFSTEILEECFSKEELDNQEIYWIKELNAVEDDNFYNLAYGGNSSRFTIKTRMKMSLSKKGKKPWNYGIPKTDAEREYLSNRLKGRKSWAKGLTKYTDSRVAKWSKPHSTETKQKISIAKKGQPSKLKGTHLTDEHKLKISSSKKGKSISAAHREKCSNAHKKSVLCIESGIIYDSFLSAAQACGYKSRNPIYYCIIGKRETAGGFHWKLIE